MNKNNFHHIFKVLKSKKNLFTLTVFIIVIFGAIVALNSKSTNVAPIFTNDSNNQASTTIPSNDKLTNIIVSSPVSNQIIQSPLTIEGKARGSWYFEASFPIKLYDINGELLGTTSAQATDDWMTDEFVPFKAILDFKNSTGTSGTLIFIKDNPSGLPGNDAQLQWPVKFPEVTEKAKINVYFNNSRLDPDVSCDKVFAVEREVVRTPAIARAALTELLFGPTTIEIENGYSTSLNPNIIIQNLTIKDGAAKVDFNEQLQTGVGGSCRVAAIGAQIRDTLLQFPSIKSVEISINGRSEDILQP